MQLHCGGGIVSMQPPSPPLSSQRASTQPPLAGSPEAGTSPGRGPTDWSRRPPGVQLFGSRRHDGRQGGPAEADFLRDIYSAHGCISVVIGLALVRRLYTIAVCKVDGLTNICLGGGEVSIKAIQEPKQVKVFTLCIVLLFGGENFLSMRSFICKNFLLDKGKVKQIVGSTLQDAAGKSTLITNFESDQSPSEFSELYKQDSLTGGHVIMLGTDDASKSAATEALHAYPEHASGGLYQVKGAAVQVGGAEVEPGRNGLLLSDAKRPTEPGPRGDATGSGRPSPKRGDRVYASGSSADGFPDIPKGGGGRCDLFTEMANSTTSALTIRRLGSPGLIFHASTTMSCRNGYTGESSFLRLMKLQRRCGC
ncbi:hypothetical protein KSP39_PZI023861 [Platanthera zijinensis]|uniref:Uncharacterized protein n=1 Tax=Platanthera zijinensis TaxID=2320716 RepID=A0AAP0FTG5_9ASPA